MDVLVFCIGGALMLGIRLAARSGNTFLAGVIGGLPIGLISTVLVPKALMPQYVTAYLYILVANFVAGAATLLALMRHLHFVLGIGIGILVWLVVITLKLWLPQITWNGNS